MPISQPAIPYSLLFGPICHVFCLFQSRFRLTARRDNAHTLANGAPNLNLRSVCMKEGPHGPGGFTSSFCHFACRGLLLPSTIRIAARVGRRTDRRGCG